MKPRLHPGLFVVLESAEEGAGKTTLARGITENLRAQGYPIQIIREPGGTEWGERVRMLVLEFAERPPISDLFAMCSSRAALVEMVIRPALMAGEIVICDRFTMSSLAYQGEASGLGFDLVRQVCDLATTGLQPDLTLFLHLSPDEAERRRKKDLRVGDYFERDAFQTRAREGYARAVAEDPSVIVLDADTTPEAVLTTAIELITPHLPDPENRPPLF